LVIPENSKELADYHKNIIVAYGEVSAKGRVIKTAQVEVILLNEKDEFVDEDDEEVLVNAYKIRTRDVIREAKSIANFNPSRGLEKIKDFKEELTGCALSKDPIVVGLIRDLERVLKEIENSRNEILRK